MLCMLEIELILSNRNIFLCKMNILGFKKLCDVESKWSLFRGHWYCGEKLKMAHQNVGRCIQVVNSLDKENKMQKNMRIVRIACFQFHKCTNKKWSMTNSPTSWPECLIFINYFSGKLVRLMLTYVSPHKSLQLMWKRTDSINEMKKSNYICIN